MRSARVASVWCGVVASAVFRGGRAIRESRSVRLRWLRCCSLRESRAVCCVSVPDRRVERAFHRAAVAVSLVLVRVRPPWR
eukprot:11170430-Lingulodinium_polyedra.AAC.1